MNNLNIGILAQHINPNIYGSSRNMYFLARLLENKGHNITIICPDYPTNLDSDLNIVTVPNDKSDNPLNGLKFSLPENMRAAKKVKEMEKDFDIIHSNCCFGFPYLYSNEKPYVLHLRTESIHLKNLIRMFSSDDFFSPSSLKIIPGQIATWKFQRISIQKSDTIICNSVETANEIRKISDPFYKKTRELYNGIDVDYFINGNGERIRDEYNLQNKKILVCVIRLNLSKGIYRLLNVMELIIQKRDDIVLLIVGGGNLMDAVMNEIENKNLSRHVILTDHITKEFLADYYDAADLFIYPSSPGTTLMEAMAASKPFVLYYTSNDVPPGVPLHRIRDKNIGEILLDTNIQEFAEAIIQHIDDESWLRENGSRGFQFVNTEMNWDKVIDELLDCYRQTILQYD